MIIHLLPNAHLDPVWLWDWREGLTEGVTTVETILALMKEFPELTFIRGESVIYRHIQDVRPDLFRQIRKMIESGRWDVVGGTFLQPDSNLASTETLCRQFDEGLRYFREELGVRPRISWQADSFGHPAGWPNILRNAGMEGFAFSRPNRKNFAMEYPAFWWRGAPGKDLLCYRQHWDWYGCERSNMAQVLDSTLEQARKLPLQNVGVFFGLGNHGGGPTRRHLRDVQMWRGEHPEVEVKFSTIHGLFRALEREIAAGAVTLPRVEGEFGHCLRGCYSSVQRFKSRFREAEAGAVSVEMTDALLGGDGREEMAEVWESVLFNSFHDILPGTSIERAMADQERWVGGAFHAAQNVRFRALTRLAARVDTTVPPAEEDRPRRVPVLLWNALPRPFSGPVEIEAALDYRPLFEFENRPSEAPFGVWDEKGRPMPFQEIPTEHSSLVNLPWRKRAVVSVTLPPWGWRVITLGSAPQKLPPTPSSHSPRVLRGEAGIAGGKWKIQVSGSGDLVIRHGSGSVFPRGRSLGLVTVEDPWGSWGGMNEEPESFQLDRIRERWRLTRHQVLEQGPERASLWTQWHAGSSRLELTFELARSLSWISVRGRLLWNERSARLQLVVPSSGPAVCDIPGGIVERRQRGQCPVGRWFLRNTPSGGTLGVATDVLSDCDFLPNETRLTLARATRFADDVPTGPEERPWQPATDCGELHFQLRVFDAAGDADSVADFLLHPPEVMSVTPQVGPLPKWGSLGKLTPSSVKLLSLRKVHEQKILVRVQNRGKRAVETRLSLGKKTFRLGLLRAQQILTKELRVPHAILDDAPPL